MKNTIKRILTLVIVTSLTICQFPNKTYAFVGGEGSASKEIHIGQAINWEINTNDEKYIPVRIHSGTLPSGIEFTTIENPPPRTAYRVKGTALAGTAKEYPIQFQDEEVIGIEHTYTVKPGPQTIVCEDKTILMSTEDSIMLEPFSRDGNGDSIDVSKVNSSPDFVDKHQPTYIFSGGNEAVATIDTNGKVAIKGPGTTEFIIDSHATESYTAAEQKTVIFTVKEVPILTNGKLQDGIINTEYSESLVDYANAGTPPYSFELSNNSTLPAGLALAPDGTISGTPSTIVENHSFEVTLTDDFGAEVTGTYTLTVKKSPVSIKEIQGVIPPVRGAEPVRAIDDTVEYTGQVSWEPDLSSDGKFAANTEYTATINLIPKDGYTLQGVSENFFTVAGAAATNDADSGEITAVFPKTAPIPHSHSYGDWKSDGTDHWRQCSCGSISDKASHDFSKWTVDQKPDEDGKVSSSRECTVCGYKQTEKHVPQTLSDPESGVNVKGDFTSGAAISVKEAVLHEEGICKVCDEIRARQADGELIVLYDISLTSGINSGEMEISIPVDEKYNGQTVILLHCMDKEEERLEVKVEKGLVTFTTKSLSPFAVLDTKKAESIKLASSSLTLEIGKSRQLTYTVTPENIHSDKVTWTTSDKKVATVSPSGKVQAMKAGTATITCMAADGGGAKATCKVTVKNTATPLLNLRGTAGKNSIRLNWNQVSNADGYEIYGSRCGSRYSYGKVKSITKGSTKTWTQKGLRSGTAYKYYIKAYKLVNGKKLYLKTSLTSHVATTGSRYTNTKTVTTTFTDITLAKGKARQISARITPVKKGGKLANHVPEFRYKTTNSKVATVNASGKITAAGKGKCSVYVYANNGVTRRILITVK